MNMSKSLMMMILSLATMMTTMLVLCPQGAVATAKHPSASGSSWKWRSSSDATPKRMSFQDRSRKIISQAGAKPSPESRLCQRRRNDNINKICVLEGVEEGEIYEKLSKNAVFPGKFHQESPRQTKPKKGPKRKVHELRPFL